MHVCADPSYLATSQPIRPLNDVAKMCYVGAGEGGVVISQRARLWGWSSAFLFVCSEDLIW